MFTIAATKNSDTCINRHSLTRYKWNGPTTNCQREFQFLVHAFHWRYQFRFDSVFWYANELRSEKWKYSTKKNDDAKRPLGDRKYTKMKRHHHAASSTTISTMALTINVCDDVLIQISIRIINEFKIRIASWWRSSRKEESTNRLRHTNNKWSSNRTSFG